jgi:hypothetical protein
MSAIAAANSSATNAIALLLSNAASSTTAIGTPATKAVTSGSSASSDPTDILDLSDNAKATLARAKIDQVAATPGGKATAPKANSSGGTSLFDKLSGRAQPAQTGQWDVNAAIADPAGYLKAQQAAHTGADGSIASWSTSATDVFTSPSTPTEIDQWYQTQGNQLVAQQQTFPQSALPGLTQAIQDRTLTITNAADIPDLNFHNSFTWQGGEGGAGNGGGMNYNPQAAALQDPNVQHYFLANGTVISWASPSAQS